MIRDSTLGGRAIQTPFDFSSSGDNIVIPSGVGLFKVLQIFFVLANSANMIFKSGSTAISGTLPMLGFGSFWMNHFDIELTAVASGDPFIINIDAAVQVGGTLWYVR